MKLNRWTACAAAALTTTIFSLILSGCGGGGQKTHELDSRYYGDLYGVQTVPVNQETSVAVDTWIEVSWPDPNYPPPSNFTVSVEKEESPNVWGGIHTVQRDDYSKPDAGEWWFEPSNPLSTDTWYRIIVKDDSGRQAISYFQTILSDRSGISSLSKTSTKTYKPANATSSGADGAVEHLIKISK